MKFKREYNDYINIETGKKLIKVKDTETVIKKVTGIMNGTDKDIVASPLDTYKSYNEREPKRQNMTSKEALKYEMWAGLINGNKIGPEEMFCFGFLTDTHWYMINDKKSYDLFKAFAPEVEELEEKFFNLGWHHSDHNRFADIVAVVGWEKGIKFINDIIDFITTNPSSEHERTHGDDRLMYDGHCIFYQCYYFTATSFIGRTKIFLNN